MIEEYVYEAFRAMGEPPVYAAVIRAHTEADALRIAMAKTLSLPNVTHAQIDKKKHV